MASGLAVIFWMSSLAALSAVGSEACKASGALTSAPLSEESLVSSAALHFVAFSLSSSLAL
eukprot:1781843-Alexandrium_andersonii.AAC.1